jgi:hypothetical protein
VTYLLGWDPDPPADNVILYRVLEEFGGGGCATVGWTKAPTAQFLVTDLESGSTHFYAVTAIDANNLESPISNVVEIDVPPFTGGWQPPPPTPPPITLPPRIDCLGILKTFDYE